MLITDFRDQNSLIINLVEGKHPVIVEETGEAYISGKRGRITPYLNNGREFCLYVWNKTVLNDALGQDWLQEHQCGDEEGYLIFKRGDFNKAKRFCKLRTKRTLSPEQRKACSERLKSYRFHARSDA